MKFAIFVIDDESRSGSTQEMAAIDKFNEKLRTNGQWVMAVGLESPKTPLFLTTEPTSKNHNLVHFLAQQTSIAECG